jgi:hypothetical protein
MRKGLICSLLLYLSCASALWAQAFQNLDFESATVVPISGDTYNRVYFSLALPGWSGFSGTNQLSGAPYDNIFLDSAGIAILDSNFAVNPNLVIQGNYTVLLQSGDSLFPGGGAADASLSETGLVPIGTRSLTFLARPIGPFSVSLGGSNLNLISFPVANQNYNLYEVDISAFAALTEPLTFTALAQPIHSNDGWLYLDDIQFSPDAIPEPGSLSLVLVGVACLALWQLRRGRTAWVAALSNATEVIS